MSAPEAKSGRIARLTFASDHLRSLQQIRDQLAAIVKEADSLGEHALSACVCHALDRAEDSMRRRSKQRVLL